MRKKLICGIVVLALFALAGVATAADPGKGNILVEEWTDTDGAVNNDLNTLKAYSEFPDNPSRSYWVQEFDRPDGGEDNWGARLRGYLYPPQTGDYTFWTCSDDDSELWLSTDEDPANIAMIANVEGWMPYQAWDGAGGAPGTDFKSDPISLQAGKRYYVEALFADGTGGGQLSVGWAGPGIGAEPTLIAGKYLAPVIRDPEPMFQARNPDPADGAVGVQAPLLQWSAGATAFMHNMYFGTDPNPPFIGPQMVPLYFHAPGLTPGQEYFWKVDSIESDGVTTHEGNVWSFVAQAETAYLPVPVDGDGSVSPDVTLTWQAGLAAVQHQLYLSEDLDAVTQGTAAADKGALDDTEYTPEGLLGATTYYWRVDEIGPSGAVKTGDVWSFTTFMLVDNFEGYTDDMDAGEAVFQTWVDGLENGTGSVVGHFESQNGTFNETTIVHGGGQSMLFDYDNSNSPWYSQAKRTWPTTQDWTINALTDLTLYVRGYSAGAEYTEEAGVFTIAGEGTDIWDTADEFTYLHKQLTGNGSLVARVVSNGTGSNEWAKGGVMIRQSLDAGSTHSFMPITAGGGNGGSFQYRPIADASSLNADVDAANPIEPPYWVKLERSGSSLTGSISPDGNVWTQLGTPQFIVMADPIYIGLAVTSHAAGEYRTFEFDNVQQSGGVSGGWQLTEIGLMKNDSVPLYVALEDSTGKIGVVSDPNMATVTDWTEWKISLSDFGVDASRIKAMYLGAGDPDNPTPGGSGRVFIDDIRVLKPAPAADE